MREIVTLDRSLLLKKHQQILDCSGATAFTCRMGYLTYKLSYRHIGRYLPFPIGTRGMLYYHVDPSLPPISGSLRFRLCDAPEEFERGSDLQVGPGQPWAISLCRLVRSKSQEPIRKMLLDEGLIEQDLVAAIQGLNLGSRIDDHVRLYQLQQPMVVSLPHHLFFVIRLVTLRSSSVVNFRGFFRDRSRECAPYQGKVYSVRSISTILTLAQALSSFVSSCPHYQNMPMNLLWLCAFLKY